MMVRAEGVHEQNGIVLGEVELAVRDVRHSEVRDMLGSERLILLSEWLTFFD